MMLRGLQAGARDYLFKDTDRATLLDTIYTAAKGDTLLKPEILHRVLAMPPSPKRSKYPEGEDNPLTDREREVLRAAARGDRNKEIAYKLGISEHTVKAHLTSI